jgi:hypothetical protein
MPEISTGPTERKAETMTKASYSEIMGWETEKRPVLLLVYTGVRRISTEIVTLGQCRLAAL